MTNLAISDDDAVHTKNLEDRCEKFLEVMDEEMGMLHLSIAILLQEDDDIHTYEKKYPKNWKLLEKLADNYFCQARWMFCWTEVGR